MLLTYSAYGTDTLPPLFILHGFLGSKQNWHSIATQLSKQFYCIVPDARNHGDSFHDERMTYSDMSEDIMALINHLGFSGINLLGHSMGGKTAMTIALTYPDYVRTLIIVDISTRAFPPAHLEILDSLKRLELDNYNSRKAIDNALALSIKDNTLRNMLLKNITRTNDNSFRWKIPLDYLLNNYSNIIAEITSTSVFTNPTLFIRGENSDYIQINDLHSIASLFPKAEIVTITKAGHNVHIDNPMKFIETITEFLSVNNATLI